MTNAGKVFGSVGLEGLQSVAENIARQTGEVQVWLFHGEMGSGKTTLIKEVCRFLQVKDAMSSPTFSIVNEYERDAGKIYHFDFYRLKSEREAFDIGTEEYFYSGNPCFVEWPEKIPSLIPDRYGEVIISIQNETHRDIAILIHDGEEKNRL
ncbi:MAG TPA: tRNA (adenosine(37)-N6)-threonylcarbamoyltransferase complex ATPase subunit type 1 TsaE [Ohtaekwangia sp.]